MVIGVSMQAHVAASLPSVLWPGPQEWPRRLSAGALGRVQTGILRGLALWPLWGGLLSGL